MSFKRVRVRFAPSPTGALHIGGVRTALYNYLFAKQHRGDFILRIEDTDQARYVAGAESYILRSLAWCGLPPDESPEKGGDHAPYRQSERKAIYQKYIQQLVHEGKAYYAFDTPESLNAHREAHQKKGKTFIYNWHNRQCLDNALTMTDAQVKAKLASGVPYVVRFLMPQKEVVLKDLIRGEIVVDTRTLDDKILFKSDGMPTYHFANVVDDHLMEISHVIRGEEWLPSLALHVLLYEAFGWEAPDFAHLPLILKPTGKGKLSKRDGVKGGFPVFPLTYDDGESTFQGYDEAGYEPAAFVNMLALLGWNDGTDNELFSLQDLMAHFSLERVQRSGAKFNPEKARWFNAQYLQQKDTEALCEAFKPILAEKAISVEAVQLQKIVNLVRERAVFVKDLWDLTTYFWQAPEEYDVKAVKKVCKAGTEEMLQGLYQQMAVAPDFEASALRDFVKSWIAEKSLGMGKVMQPLRLALVGAMKGVDLFEIMAIIGQTSSLERIQLLLNHLEKATN